MALAASLFLSSGRLDWVMAWIYIGIRMGIAAISLFLITSKYPGLLEERYHSGEGAKAWDRLLASITTLLLLGILMVAGFDMPFGWSPELALSIQLVALVVLFL